MWKEDSGAPDNSRGSGNFDSQNPDADIEQGSFAMLMFALVGLASGFILPYFALGGDSKARAPALPPADQVTPDIEGRPSRRSLAGATWFRQSARRIYYSLRYGITLRSLLSLGCLTFAFIMVGTFFISTPTQAIVLIALVGIPWSITAWAPYALIGEFIREASAGLSPYEFEDDHHGPRRSAERRLSRRRRSQVLARDTEQHVGLSVNSRTDGDVSPASHSGLSGPSAGEGQSQQVQAALLDCEPLRSRRKADDRRGVSRHEAIEDLDDKDEGTMAGTVIGIHNLAIVIPQLMVSDSDVGARRQTRD